MGFVLEGDLINSYVDTTKNGKQYTVYQVSYRAGKQVITVNLKDYYNHGLSQGSCKVQVFPDVWVGKNGTAVISWIVSADQGPSAKSEGGKRMGLAV